MHQAVSNINNSSYSLNIPRAKLNSSSSSSGASSISRSRDFSPNFIQQKRYSKRATSSEEKSSSNLDIESEWDERNEKSEVHHQKYYVHKVRKANLTATQSSSSSSSNQSNHSVNSLLLSVKNLENFNNRNVVVEGIDHNKIYNTSDNIYRTQMLENIKNILAIDNGDPKTSKRKEPDQISTSSTATNTNFTVITFNGFEKNKQKKPRRAICRRRHQVTIVIICMTFLLFVGISSAVCMLEMRYQKMPR